MILWSLAKRQKGEEASKAVRVESGVEGHCSNGQTRGKGLQAEVQQIQSHVGVTAGVLGRQCEGRMQAGEGQVILDR